MYAADEKPMPLDALIEDAQRVLRVCNACRYCEGYCAMFPAMARRLEFTENDIHYLGNLCHNCGSCLYACQFSPPHEFQVNVPRLMARVRGETYRRYAWPGFLGRLYDNNGVAVSLISAFSIALLFWIAGALSNPERFFAAHSDAQGSFYALMPHDLMVAMFGGVSIFVLIALLVGFFRFWPYMGEDLADFFKKPLAEGLHDAFTLKNLGGGGEGCTYPTEQKSFARRIFHHFTFYGFMLCFAATSVATVYHYALDYPAPYPYLSLPVILGTVGGIGLLIGPAGLLWIKAKRDPELAYRAQDGMDAGLLVLLFMVSLTGLGLMIWRETGAMGTWLAVHLGFVLALFLTMPYGKFVHGMYRLMALVRHHLERRRPVPGVAPE
ncbi:MAG: tricarballylate utilization 4Fe-4S protein TcuB [Burkholderiales bacterium]|nr:tricarballylate utilization 4Fe-4S protein TcuB [Burkholderiales bacterium]MDP2397603.1 tricarballylate utilization 4Fe-4S protein TcuB [Burkholderiales bacterium]